MRVGSSAGIPPPVQTTPQDARYAQSADSIEDLVHRCQAGDEDAFDELVRLNKRRIYAIARRLIPDQDGAEDAVVEVLVQLHRSIKSFKHASAFSTWLHRIVLNVCGQELRRNQRRQRNDGHADMRDDDPPSPAELAEQKSESDTVLELVDTLPEVERVAVLYYYLGECSYPELARVLGVPEGTAKSRVFRGLERVRSMQKQRADRGLVR